MGVGNGSGEKRAEDAAKAAINSPLLDLSIHGAKGVLFSIAGGDDLTMYEIQDAAKIITESIDSDAKVIFGTVHDERLQKGEVRVTVVAAGFPDNSSSKRMVLPIHTNNPEPEEKEKRGKIFNSIMPSKEPKETKVEIKETTKSASVDDKKLPQIEEHDDDWGAVPAFLRRSKIK